jgi:hypothetical protein
LLGLVREGIRRKPKGHNLSERYYPLDHMSSIGG